MNKSIKYSVVATVFNDEKEILNLLKDIRLQSYAPEEIIIVDGGSKDNTCKIIRSFDNNIRLIQGERLNISEGLNKAVQEANSLWVGIVAVGNRYKSDYFKLLINNLQQSVEEYDGAYSKIEGKVNTKFSKLYDEFFLKNIGDNRGMATNHGVLLQKKVFEQNGYFYENFVYAGEDAEFYRRLKRANRKFLYVEESIVCWETPQSYKEYFKQERRYGIGHMQMFTNKVLFRLYIKHFIYLLIPIAAILFAIVGRNKCYSLLLLLLFLLVNIRMFARKGWNYCKGKNMYTLTVIICMFLNSKYFLNKYKIEEKFIINEVI